MDIATNKKILVVEDDKSLRTAIVNKLTLNGFKVAGTVDGEEGVRIALEWHPDLVILDILMPKMDGVTVLKVLRINFGKELPVIILTNVEADDKLTDSVVEFQPSYFLLKSNTKLEDLVGYTRKVLNLDGQSE